MFIIAEAGVNHNGDLDRALSMVEVAAKAGADAIKFQTFTAASLVTRDAPKAEYQRLATGGDEGQFEMLRRLELDEAAHVRLAGACAEAGIEFMSTAFDEASVDLLLRVGVRRMKVPSGEITNGRLLLKIARTGLPIILSTGMADIGEIGDALAVLAWGRAGRGRPSGLAELRAFGTTAEARATLDGAVTILQCSTAYPAPPEAINLRVMDTLALAFDHPVGLSDHSVGLPVPFAAAGRGAVMLEKHFTLDRTLPGPDHSASLEPDELAEMVRGVRMIAAALGDGVKRPAASELPNIPIARRGLVAVRDLTQGAVIEEDDVAALRPAAGLSPMAQWDLIGRPAAEPLPAGAAIPEGFLSRKV